MNTKLRQIPLIALLMSLALGTSQAQTITAPLSITPEVWADPSEVGPAWSMVWGDVDNDGDLDLAVSNTAGPNRLYLNNDGTLGAIATQSFGEGDNTRSLAWGDVDGDGDLDLAAGNFGKPGKIYYNDNGILQEKQLLAKNKETRSLAWGDADGDGDLDLAVGNKDAPNQLYLNDKGILQEALTFGGNEDTRSVAWGEVKGKSDPLLAVGNFAAPNRLYRYQQGTLVEVQTFDDGPGNTTSLAWGDVDGDGDLDLAVGHRNQPNRVYFYDATADALDTKNPWTSNDSPTDFTQSVAWADVDGDGDLDLVAGNEGGVLTGADKIYRNDNGVLSTETFWVSDLKTDTRSLAWGDVDSDGDLDLAVGNIDGPNLLYSNMGQGLQQKNSNADNLFWTSTETDQTRGVAWGDADGDGDLDLAVAAETGFNKLYLNNSGVLIGPQTFGNSTDSSTSLAWGDVNGDGRLELAVGHKGAANNQLYRYENGTFQELQTFGTATADTSSLAWGDMDGDGDLDLAVGKIGAPNEIYRNDNGVLVAGSSFDSSSRDTRSVAWGDVDGDGNLDLAVGNSDGANKLYLNNDGTLQEAQSFGAANDKTASLAWGDVDSDGDLDLAAGTSGPPNKFYRNDDGTLTEVPTFNEADDTRSVAWGDVDGDGDLDLAVGNFNDQNRVYFNRGGTLQIDTPWLSGNVDIAGTRSVAWGDVDGDGDLDLAAGNSSDLLLPLRADKVYLNQARENNSPLNEPGYAALGRPGVTDDAFFYATPDIQLATNLTIAYTLFDPEGDAVPRIYPEYSPNGGGRWFPATPGAGGDGLTNLSASSSGTPHIFVWNAEADLIKSDNVVFRVKVHSGPNYSPILWPAQASDSPPFRVEAASFIRVVTAAGRPVAGASVYAAGNPLEQTLTGLSITDQAGLLNPGPLPPGTKLVALALQAEEPSTREGHEGWAYRTYLTNLNVDAVGDTTPFIVNQTEGEQRLVVRPEQTLIVFNILISVEWDANEAYLQDVAAAMAAAADFLYDISDGQMTFGQVTIYDNAEYWTEADIQISAKNVVHPHAYIGGLFEADHTNLIRVGRSWDGNTANTGNWSQSDGYRTLVHEFGHYALGLYDEYFGYELIGGELGGRIEAYCLDPGNRTAASDATNASIMDFHYTSSELADAGRWGVWCQETAQQLLNNGEADWQTLMRLYGDAQNRWRLVTPDERAGVGQVVPGPAQLPDTMPFPTVTYTNANTPNDPAPFTLQVCGGGQPYLSGAWVTVVKVDGKTMDQGLTDDLSGQLTILGANPADSLQVVSLDGSLSAAKQIASVQVDGFIDLGGGSNLTLLGQERPYLRLWPTTSNGSLDGLRLVMDHTLSGDSLTYAVTDFNGLGAAATLPYEGSSNQHQIQVGFIPTALAGYARVQGSHVGSFTELNVDYRLQAAVNDRSNDLFSNDGNLKLYLAAGSLPLAETHFLIASPWGLPGPLPAGVAIVGEAYEITASDNLTMLERPGVLRLRYDAIASAAFVVDTIAIYRWDFGTATWQALPSERDEETQEVVTPINELGLYALLGTPLPSKIAVLGAAEADIKCGSGLLKNYLPLILKN